MPNSVALPYVVEIGWLHIPIVDHQFMDKSLISMLASVTRLSKCSNSCIRSYSVRYVTRLCALRHKVKALFSDMGHTMTLNNAA